LISTLDDELVEELDDELEDELDDELEDELVDELENELVDELFNESGDGLNGLSPDTIKVFGTGILLESFNPLNSDSTSLKSIQPDSSIVTNRHIYKRMN